MEINISKSVEGECILETLELACRRMEWLNPFYRQVWQKAYAEKIPITGTFELTPRCNFQCKMCYVHLNNAQISQHGRELTADEWINIAKEAKQAGTTWLCITGGEPLLYPEFPKIWRKLTEMGFFLTLQTNASLITGEVEKLLEEYPPRQVKVTLYGANNDVYRDVCGVERGFDLVNQGIHVLMKLGIPVRLVSTLIRQNVENAADMAKYARQCQLPWTSTGGIKSSNRGVAVDVDALSVNEICSLQRKLQIQSRFYEKRWMDPSRKPCTYCADYRMGYWIMWNGEMRFCSFLNEPHLSLQSMLFQEAWRHLMEYEETLDWPERCQNCEAAVVCMKCAATAPYGDAPSRACDETKKLYAELKKKGKDS